MNDKDNILQKLTSLIDINADTFAVFLIDLTRKYKEIDLGIVEQELCDWCDKRGYGTEARAILAKRDKAKSQPLFIHGLAR